MNFSLRWGNFLKSFLKYLEINELYPNSLYQICLNKRIYEFPLDEE